MSTRKMRLWGIWTGALITFSSCAAATAAAKVSRMKHDIEQRASAGEFMGLRPGGPCPGKAIIDKGYRYADIAAKVPTIQTRNIDWGP